VTVSPDAAPLVFTDLADAIGALRAAGLRISTPRRLVLEALFAADGPVSAADLARELSLDESSVYRNLEVLEQLGVARHVHLGHSPGLYALVSDEVVEYLYCERCAKVTTVAPSRLDTIRGQIRAEFGYSARFTHFAIVGLCPDCATEPPSGARKSPAARASPPRTHGHEHTREARRRRR
jgi:Fur family transcriptional regulator, ferric uptake regulator